MDPSLMSEDELEARRHIVVPMGQQPQTRAGQLAHKGWHDMLLDEVMAGMREAGSEMCGTAGCGFLGTILAIEAESRAYDPDPASKEE